MSNGCLDLVQALLVGGLSNLRNAMKKKYAYPGGSVAKNQPANARVSEDADSIPGSGRSLGGGNDNPL